ncbi:phosphotransferase [Streptomyces sp. SID625]|nr:phosphotransferase [Streptomyces sp. SID625]
MTEPTAPRAVCPAGGASRTSSEMLALRLPQDTVDRLRVQARHGAAVLGVVADGTDCVWGWQGTSVSMPVLDTGGAQRWMKLRSRPAADPVPALWSGVATAEQVMAGLPVLRPVLLAQQAWTCDGFAYQAELTTRMPVRSISLNRAAPQWMADLPAAWWADLRAALDSLQEVAPAAVLRRVAWQETAARSMGAVHPAPWVPSHGDMCPANLGVAGATAVLFDWEYIGLGPRFVDAATLLLSSLDTPDVTDCIWSHFGDQLATPEGIYAQSVVAAHFAGRFRAGEHVDLAPALRAHMRTLEERTDDRHGGAARCTPC